MPSIPYPLRVLVQCKALKTPVSPEVVRELEGAAAGAPEGFRGGRTITVLCAKKPATKGVREAIRRCGVPVVWVMVEDIGEGIGRVRQVLWNEGVNQVGAEGMAVGLRYLPGDEGKGIAKECVLLYNGKPWVVPEVTED